MLDEPAWQAVELADRFTQAEPREGADASRPTRVRVLAGSKAIVIGIECDDPNPDGIVSFSKQRDPELFYEDHVRVVLGPFLDGRSGYVFAANLSGARYDALIEPGGEDDNPNWDGIWERPRGGATAAGRRRSASRSTLWRSNPARTSGISTSSAESSGFWKPIGGRRPNDSST